MGKLRRWRYYAVQLLLNFVLWRCAATAQSQAGFVSIDCGSSLPNYTYTPTDIVWTSDAHLVPDQGTTIFPVDGLDPPLNTMRLFTGNQSKYCYRFSVTPGAFFLVRAWFSIGASIPYTPNSVDGLYRFKLLIDADEWFDLEYAYDSFMYSSSTSYEAYTRALHDSIDVCLARSNSVGDNPFISALELRPLPSSLSATGLMNTTNHNFFLMLDRADCGAASSFASYTRYPSDPFDRIWNPKTEKLWKQTIDKIDTSKDKDKPPEKVLQTATLFSTNRNSYAYGYNNVGNGMYFYVIYFAEIDGRVNASGQRVFTISDGATTLNAQPIDVFKEVGAFTSYEMAGSISADKQGNVAFIFSATPTSLFPPMLGAVEIFQASNKPLSFGSASSEVTAIEDLKESMNLNSYIGDPCLPSGYGYSWLTCTNVNTSTEVPRIISISLSNYTTGGKIPKSINTLTMLDKILLDGNNLEGSIPNMSSLANLEILDLSNNKLNGSIPESLATLTKLKVLNLSNNGLTGEIPANLLLRKQASTLDFNFSGNPLCETSNKVMCTLPPLPSSKSKRNIGLVVGVAIGVLFIVMIGVSLTIFYLYKKKLQFNLKNLLSNPFTQKEIPLLPSSSSTPNPVFKGPLQMFSIQELTLEDIKFATNNFSTKVGQGGFGPVYKGFLKSGDIVAIKVSSNSSHQGSKEFLNEVDILSRVHHKNLVRLLGFCKEKELILVYEYMSKGSLFDCLHGEIVNDSPLSWSTRLRILVDAAQGLDYLHYGCHPQIIHRDIKSSNILLNDKLEAKISDFGISRSSFISEGGAPTTTLMGSMGYIDPEYISNARLTEKVDMYSFGVVIFEVICGRRPIFMDASHKATHILDWIMPHIDRGAIDIIVDSSLQGYYNISSVWKVLDVALACVKFPSDQRPDMSIVYSYLKEAQSMDLERYQHDTFDMQHSPTTFIENDPDSLPLTHVLPR